MGFNYAKEKRKFEMEWKKLSEQYREAGFDETGIEKLRTYDWEAFCNRRTYINRERSFPDESIGDDNHSTLFQKYSALTVSFDENTFTSRFGWIDAIDNPVLTDKLIRLSDEDKELLTLLVFDGYTQTEIANLRGCSKVAICKKIKRIKNFLKHG